MNCSAHEERSGKRYSPVVADEVGRDPDFRYRFLVPLCEENFP
jgi:hypothetical protein